MRPPILSSWLPLWGALALLAAPAGAGEIAIFGRHPLTGARGEALVRGSLEVFEDGRIRLERRCGAAEAEAVEGRARVFGRTLRLELDGGGIRDYAFGEVEGRVALSWRDEAGWERVDLGPAEGGVAAAAGRVLRRDGALNWALNLNWGEVDGDAAAPIWRSRQPTPAALEAREAEVKTVLSLNGELDVPAFWRPREEDGGLGPLREVRLGPWLRERGFAHVALGMSASRAPSDEELVAAFRVLLDDARKPILLHCKGGSDRTGIIAALYRVEFLGWSKAQAKDEMRRHLWAAHDGTEVQGLALDLYELGRIRRLLAAAGFEIPERYRERPASAARAGSPPRGG